MTPAPLHLPLALALALLPAAQEVAPPELQADFWWADYDGDGLEDALVLAPGGKARLLRNAGDGTLADATERAGLSGLSGIRFALWADYDRDGAVDLFVASNEGPSRLFKGNGAAFEDVTLASGLTHDEPALHGGWLDYDLDGLPDLHVRTRVSYLLYHNLGAGNFESVPLELPVPTVLAAPRQVAHADASSAGVEAPADETPPAGSRPGAGAGGRSAVAAWSSPGRAGVSPEPADPAGAGGTIEYAFCQTGILDQASGGCLYASSTPTLGQLYPLSSDLYVDPGTGFVGLGTTLPASRLHVEGDQRVTGNLDTHSLEFRSSGAPSDPMILMLRDGLVERMVLGESVGYERTGLKYDPNSFEFRFQFDDTFPPALAVDLNGGVVGIGTDSPTAEIHIADTGDARLFLESDTDNSNEQDQPHIQFSQDGGVVQARIGYFDTQPHFSVMNLYDYGHLFFKVPQVSTNNFFEFHNTTLGGTSFDVEARLDEFGDWQIDGSVSSPAVDLAEFYPVVGHVEPGDVVAFTGTALSIGRAEAGDEARLAGVVSSRPAFIMGLSYTDEDEDGVAFTGGPDADRFGGDTSEFRVDREVLHEISVNGRAPLALAGRVPVKISAENGPVQAGDLLTVASIPGHAMKASEAGPVIGTALQPWTSGEGAIIAFVRLGWYAPAAEAEELAALRTEVAVLKAHLGQVMQTLGLPGSGD